MSLFKRVPSKEADAPISKAGIPESVEYKKSDSHEDFILGIGADGEEYDWTPSRESHLHVYGKTKSGKTRFLKNIIRHAYDHPEHWNVRIIDTSGDLTHIADNEFSNSQAVATNHFDAWDLLQANLEDIRDTTLLMTEHNVSTYLDLPEDVRPKASLLAIDEVEDLLMNSGDNELDEKILEQIRKIQKVGASSGIFLAISSFPSELTLTRAASDIELKLYLGEYPDSVSANSDIPGRFFDRTGFGSIRQWQSVNS